MDTTRMEHKNKKKKRGRKLFLFLLVLLLIITGYTVFQYYQGLQMADAGDKKENYEFNGDTDENGRVNILLMGVDSRSEEKSRTDTMMIAQIDPKTNETKLVSLMRDIYVEIPGYQNYKLNTAFYLGGPELLRKTIKQNFGVEIQHYMLVDFKGFEKTVDILAPNGIKIDVEKAMSENIGVQLEQGTQRLNGKELLGYARFRADREGDFGRVERQQKVISAVKEEALSLDSLTKLPKMIGATQPYIETNMGKFDQLGLIKDVLLDSNNIKKLTIPVEGSYTNGYYEHAGSVIEINFAQNSEELQKFLNE
ncbi:LCP family protein required for cell wall assembly [Bacillus pakistanensis]|uniref:Regulatory protein MsrR n=1 Tax=Rossellomorea pakistanensis TaxID=992288 RepID=A0ABS2N941_9BACI|nr:LCP family protein [Bacillus pakistanensis]MBM7584081.1 LCP family protein required for cell wall assembly [Bacillus pakistanensis]